MIDDALSAVDAHVAKHLFNECIVKDLLEGDGKSFKKRSVILATNALQHLNHPRVDKIVVLQEGRIVEQGSYKELSNDTIEQLEEEMSGIPDDNIEASIRKSERSESSKKDDSKLMTIEERSVGHVGLDVYLYWARAAGGVWIPVILVLVFGSVECLSFLSKWWLPVEASHSVPAYGLAISQWARACGIIL